MEDTASFLLYLSYYATIAKKQLQVYFHPMPIKDQAEHACLVLKVSGFMVCFGCFVRPRLGIAYTS
jgi:hypothetical protein